jgi:hypothetical protein
LFLYFIIHFSTRTDFSTALSTHCSQRDSGLAQRRLPLHFKRGKNVQFRITFPAGFLPPLRQTARYQLAFCRECCPFHYFVGLYSISGTVLNSITLSGCIPFWYALPFPPS